MASQLVNHPTTAAITGTDTRARSVKRYPEIKKSVRSHGTDNTRALILFM
ncbi:MAG: hypothetical protein Marn2KO_01720 [Marinobacter nauticus]|jgi:hypothetical protein